MLYLTYGPNGISPKIIVQMALANDAVIYIAVVVHHLYYPLLVSNRMVHHLVGILQTIVSFLGYCIAWDVNICHQYVQYINFCHESWLNLHHLDEDYALWFRILHFPNHLKSCYSFVSIIDHSTHNQYLDLANHRYINPLVILSCSRICILCILYNIYVHLFPLAIQTYVANASVTEMSSLLIPAF